MADAKARTEHTSPRANCAAQCRDSAMARTREGLRLDAALGAFLVLGFVIRFASVFWAFVALVAPCCAALAGVLLSGHAGSPALPWLADPVGWFGTKSLAEASPALITDLTTWRGAAAARDILWWFVWNWG